MQPRNSILFLTLIISTLASLTISGSVFGTNQQSFDDFISAQIDEYREYVKDGNFHPQDLNFFLNSSGNTGNGEVRSSILQDLREFSFFVNSSISLEDGEGTLHIDLTFPKLTVAGNYTLDGTANSVIIVRGNGPFSTEVQNINWTLKATLQINSSGYADLHWTYPEENIFTGANSTFEGIEEEELIGELIKGYLNLVGERIFVDAEVHPAARNESLGALSNYISYALSTITIDEILNGPPQTSTSTSTENPSSTTTDETSSSSPSTTDQPPSSTFRPDVIIDLGPDLVGSGWEILNLDECGYSVNINGFLCEGSPVVIRDPFQGTGFWMSPCPGKCTFHYNTEIKGNSPFRALGIRAYFSDEEIGSRLAVDIAHSSGTTHFDFRQSDGEYNEIDMSQFGTLRNINLTMSNDQTHFSILDRLQVSY